MSVNELKIVITGSAQDGGIPQAGCKCLNCLNFPRLISSLAIIDGKSVVFIDVTPDFRFQYSRIVKDYDVKLDAVYLTHAHWGHYGGLMSFGREGWNTKDMPVFMSHKFLNFLTGNQPFAELISNKNILPKIIEDGVNTDYGLIPIRVAHRDEFCDTYGYLILAKSKRVLSLPCLDYFSSEINELIQSVDLSIIDGTFYDDTEVGNRDISQIPHPRVSSSMKQFADVADKVVFTHLNHSNPLVNPHGNEYSNLVSAGFRVAEDWSEL